MSIGLCGGGALCPGIWSPRLPLVLQDPLHPKCLPPRGPGQVTGEQSLHQARPHPPTPTCPRFLFLVNFPASFIYCRLVGPPFWPGPACPFPLELQQRLCRTRPHTTPACCPLTCQALERGKLRTHSMIHSKRVQAPHSFLNTHTLSRTRTCTHKHTPLLDRRLLVR